MALPYPSMNFVPLDILTAAEMNQLVANITSLSNGTGLANGSVGTNQIAPTAVTPDKLNLTTWGSGYTGVTGLNNTVKFVSYSQIVPAGKYLILWNAKINANGNSGDYYAMIFADSTELVSQVTTTNTYNVPMSVMAIYTATGSTTIKFGGKREQAGATTAAIEGPVFIIRIG